jgi:3-oxoacyl-[acyl-carrier protein] reductase
MAAAARKVILVSGGSRGLGLDIVGHLAQAGHVVATFARSLTGELSRLAGRHPGAVRAWACDARDHAAVAARVGELAREFGRIDGLVNNAALGQDHLLAHMPPKLIGEIIAVNVEAPLLLTRIVLRQMLLQDGGGRIVNISSICGSRGFPGLAVYSATKGAMDAFTRALAREVGERGILVNAIAPGFFESEMSAVLSADQLGTIVRRTPTGRLTSTAQILPVLDMLLFHDTNMTGQVLPIDGGATT